MARLRRIATGSVSSQDLYVEPMTFWTIAGRGNFEFHLVQSSQTVARAVSVLTLPPVPWAVLANSLRQGIKGQLHVPILPRSMSMRITRPIRRLATMALHLPRVVAPLLRIAGIKSPMAPC
jgi:hypothetical protein